MRKVVEGNYTVNENRRQQQRKGNINKNEHEKKISALTYLGLVPFQNTLCLSAVETHAHKLIPTHRSQSKSILRDPSELKQKKNLNKNLKVFVRVLSDATGFRFALSQITDNCNRAISIT